MEDLDQPTTAEEINRLHQDLQSLAMQSLDHAIRIGELLSNVKTQLPHGRWIPWLNSNVKFSERTARNYISVFEHRTALKSARVADLTEAYKLLGNRTSKRGVATQEEELSSASREEVAQNGKAPRMSREEAERLTAQIIAAFREHGDQAPKRFAEIMAYCNSEFRNPAHVEKFLGYADELEMLFGPFDVPEEECQCLREYQR
jgi:DNA-directed RNA polymerase subunit F